MDSDNGRRECAPADYRRLHVFDEVSKFLGAFVDKTLSAQDNDRRF